MTKFRYAAAVVAVGAVLAAGCGSKKSTSDTTAAPATTEAAATTAAPAGTEAPATTAAASTVEQAKANAAKYLTPPKGIPADFTKLPSKPAKKKFAFLKCDVPTCGDYLAPGYAAAAKAIGWDLEVIDVKSVDPSAGMQQAIDDGADYIAITGSPYATYKNQAMAAKEKGIPILSCYSTDTPSVESNMLTECGDTTFVGLGMPILADWVIGDSNGKAHVLFATINDFTVLKAGSDAFKGEFEKMCPECTFQELNVTLEDLLAGKVPGAIASQLQANADLNYIVYAFGDMPGGVTPALKAAGLLERVKQVGGDWSKSDLPELLEGTQSAWTADPKAYAAWQTIDAAARLATGMSPADLVTFSRKVAGLQTFLLTADNKDLINAILNGQPGGVPGDWFPEGADAAFTALWQG